MPKISLGFFYAQSTILKWCNTPIVYAVMATLALIEDLIVGKVAPLFYCNLYQKSII